MIWGGGRRNFSTGIFFSQNCSREIIFFPGGFPKFCFLLGGFPENSFSHRGTPNFFFPYISLLKKGPKNFWLTFRIGTSLLKDIEMYKSYRNIGTIGIEVPILKVLQFFFFLSKNCPEIFFIGMGRSKNFIPESGLQKFFFPGEGPREFFFSVPYTPDH